MCCRSTPLPCCEVCTTLLLTTVNLFRTWSSQYLLMNQLQDLSVLAIAWLQVMSSCWHFRQGLRMRRNPKL